MELMITRLGGRERRLSVGIQGFLGLWASLNWPSLQESFLMRDSGKQAIAKAKQTPEGMEGALQ